MRELLIAPAQYGELAAALPGVATNLLAERLRALEAAGVVERRLDVGTKRVVYALSSWGMQLREAVEAIIRWSTPLMTVGRGGDTFQAQWLVIAMQALLRDVTSDSPVEVGFDIDGTVIAVQLDRDGALVDAHPRHRPETVFRAEPQVILALAAGVLTVAQALHGRELRGDPSALTAVFGGVHRAPS